MANELSMEAAKAALDAASSEVVKLGKERDAVIEQANAAYAAAEEKHRNLRDKAIDDARVAFKAKLASARKAETDALGVLRGLRDKADKAAARAKAATPTT